MVENCFLIWQILLSSVQAKIWSSSSLVGRPDTKFVCFQIYYMFLLNSFLILQGKCHKFQLTDVDEMFTVTVNFSLTDTEIQRFLLWQFCWTKYFTLDPISLNVWLWWQSVIVHVISERQFCAFCTIWMAPILLASSLEEVTNVYLSMFCSSALEMNKVKGITC